MDCTIQIYKEGLRSRSAAIIQKIREIELVFGKYPLDTFYQNLRFTVDLFYFSLYQRSGELIRADHYFARLETDIPELARKHVLAFFVAGYLGVRMDRFIEDRRIDLLGRFSDKMRESFEIDPHETFHYVSFKMFQGYESFYRGEYNQAARMMNDLRMEVSLKHYPHADMECKLFQALQYAFMDEEALCTQVLNSLKRQLNSGSGDEQNAGAFLKFLKATQKVAEFRKKVKKLEALWQDFLVNNQSERAILPGLRLDDHHIRLLANAMRLRK